MSGAYAWAWDHLTEVVLPWWETHGADDEVGGVWSCFSNDGRRQSTDKYTWSQGRWAWLCSELALELDKRGDPAADRWRDRAVATAQLLVDHAVQPSGRTWFATRSDGTPITQDGADPSSSVFADLFAALGLAGAHRWAPAAGFDVAAARILGQAETLIATGRAPSAPYPVRPGFDDLASAMTLLHTGSELTRLTGHPAGAATTERAAHRLLDDHLTGPGDATDWWEFRPHDVTDHDTLLARHRTPGHLLECLWMLVHAVDVDPTLDRPGLLPRLGSLARHALATGADHDHGGLFRYADADGGRPRGRCFGDDPYETLIEQTWDTKLWWVHVEALYATALLAGRVAEHRAELTTWHDELRDWSLATFPDPDGAEWVQIRDRAGDPLDRVVALPVKDPFHLARSLLLLHRLDAVSTTDHQENP